MALDTLAKIFALTQQGLNQPADPGFLLQVKRAVHEACALYWTELIQSDQNQVVKVTDDIPFVNNQLSYSLDDYPDMTMPDWVEVKAPINESAIQNSFIWSQPMLINRDALALYSSRQEMACAIYSDISHGRLSKTIEWSYIPYVINQGYGYFRIWYDPTIQVTTGDADTTAFPPEYNYLIAIEARIRLIPILQQMDVEKCAENGTSESILSAKLATWKMMLAQCVAEREVWAPRWKSYRLASRANQGGGFKRPLNETYL